MEKNKNSFTLRSVSFYLTLPGRIWLSMSNHTDFTDKEPQGQLLAARISVSSRLKRGSWRSLHRVILVATLSVAVMAVLSRWETSPDPSFKSVPVRRTEPLVIKPMARSIMPLPPMEYTWICQQVQPPTAGKISVVQCYHLLRVHGLTANFQTKSFKCGEDILKILTDAEKGKSCFGYPTIIRTRTGFRFPTRRGMGELAFEYHRDQCLATFAELALPLSFPLRVDAESSCIGDVLQDSISNFHLRQEELAWTALAYAHYLPPQCEWQNRYGERFSFDDLAAALIDRPLSDESCGGVHLLMALTALERADREILVLSDLMRQRIKTWLNRCVGIVLETQASNGSWGQDWNRSLLSSSSTWNNRPDSEKVRLLLTGHLAEWMLYLPENYKTPNESLRRAGEWLYSRLRQSSLEDQQRDFCPYAHAVCAIRHIAFPQNSLLPILSKEQARKEELDVRKSAP